jgi:signal transduction histidine kinase
MNESEEAGPAKPRRKTARSGKRGAGASGAPQDGTPRKGTPQESDPAPDAAAGRARLLETGVQRLLDALPALVTYVDSAECCRFCNRAHESWLGIPVASLDGMPLRDAIGAAAYARLRPALQQALAGSPSRFEGELRYARVEPRFVSVVCVPDVGAAGEVRGCYCFATDLSELRRAEQAARQAAAEAALAEERERRALAADLHDDVSQLLSLAALRLASLDRERGTRARALREQIAELIKQARQRITSLSFQLSPPVLYDVGLRAAALWLAEDLRRDYSLVVDVEEGPELAGLSEATRVTLFRALRELLLNVVRHAQTAFAQVSIQVGPRDVRLEVRDAGVGFEESIRAGGFGLASVRSRVEHLGGVLRIESVKGEGARVIVTVPHGGTAEKPNA